MRRLRNLSWTIFLAVAAAEIVAAIATVSFGLALTIALFVFASLVTVVEAIRSGDITFLLDVGRQKLKSRPGLSGSLGAVMLSSGPLSERALMFTTNDDPRRLIGTAPAPIGIRFASPVEQEISGSQVPCKIKKAGLTILCVDQFTPDGIVISKQRPGIEIRAEVNYGSPSSSTQRV